MANTVLYTKTGADKAIASAIAPLATRADLAGLATKADIAKAAAGGEVNLDEYAKKPTSSRSPPRPMWPAWPARPTWRD